MPEPKVPREKVEETQQESATTDQQESGSPPNQADRKRTGEERARENRDKEPPA